MLLLIAKRYIKDFIIFRVPEDVLSKYDFLKEKDTIDFYDKIKG